MNKGWSNVDDSQLLMIMRKEGDAAHEACVELYLRYFNDVVGRLGRMSPSATLEIRKGAAQQVFEELYRLRESDQSNESLLSFLVNSAKANLISLMQGDCDAPKISLDMPNPCDNLPSEKTKVLSSHMWASECEEAVLEAIRYLPQNQRVVVEMVCFGGYGFDHVARLVNAPAETVLSRFKAALLSIEPIIENMLPDRQYSFSDQLNCSDCEMYQDMMLDMLVVSTSKHINNNIDFHIHLSACKGCQQSFACKRKLVELLKSFGKYSGDTIRMLEELHEPVSGYLRACHSPDEQQADQISIEDINQGIEKLKASMNRVDANRTHG